LPRWTYPSIWSRSRPSRSSTEDVCGYVLRYLCGCPTDDIAWYLGVTTSTVDYHGRKAKERLEQDMPARIRRSK
jgi:hypothetical protein